MQQELYNTYNDLTYSLQKAPCLNHWYYTENKFYNIPAYKPRQIVDVTGCGDTYSTGYLYMRAQGAGYEEAGKFAAAMCTLKLEHNGPFDGTINDVFNICRSNEF